MPETHIHCKGPVLQPLHGCADVLAKSDSFLSGTGYDPPEQTSEYAGIFTVNAHLTIYSGTHCSAAPMG